MSLIYHVFSGRQNQLDFKLTSVCTALHCSNTQKTDWIYKVFLGVGWGEGSRIKLK